ncbi:MAG: hypothetical protein ACRD9W_01205 [Terriglobia bacterium]
MKARAASVPLGTTILLGPPSLAILQPLSLTLSKFAIRVQFPQWVVVSTDRAAPAKKISQALF